MFLFLSLGDSESDLSVGRIVLLWRIVGLQTLLEVNPFSKLSRVNQELSKVRPIMKDLGFGV